MQQFLDIQAKVFQHIQPHLEKVPLLFSTKGSIVALFVIVILSKFLQIGLSLLLTQRYDNVQHGANRSSSKLTWQDKLVQRAQFAHNNHWEAFIGFSVAVILALQGAAKDQKELQVLANAFVLGRVAYNVAYILGFNAPLSVVRSGIWTVGLTILVRIFAIGVPSISA